jgi:hypothetical protein
LQRRSKTFARVTLLVKAARGIRRDGENIGFLELQSCVRSFLSQSRERTVGDGKRLDGIVVEKHISEFVRRDSQAYLNRRIIRILLSKLLGDLERALHRVTCFHRSIETDAARLSEDLTFPSGAPG